MSITPQLNLVMQWNTGLKYCMISLNWRNGQKSIQWEAIRTPIKVKWLMEEGLMKCTDTRLNCKYPYFTLTHSIPHKYLLLQQIKWGSTIEFDSWFGEVEMNIKGRDGLRWIYCVENWLQDKNETPRVKKKLFVDKNMTYNTVGVKK